MGHAPMFADEDFSAFSQLIGLASLGASDVDLPKLATIYWFTLEFGVCLEENKRKAYGAGILSSVGELAYAMSDEPEFLPLDCVKCGEDYQDFPISSMQPTYFVAPSFLEVKEMLLDYCDSLATPFNPTYDENTHTIKVDRNLVGVESEVGGDLF